jgi:hypothetical protein
MIATILVTTVFDIFLSIVVFPETPWDEIFNQSQNNKSSITFAEGCGFSFNIHFLPL